ncbi:MAG TPA: DUF4845 domain-containing protein [Methylococcus sp.]|nr:DUF4845 domain-containing protein [Methylococcus sp.]
MTTPIYRQAGRGVIGSVGLLLVGGFLGLLLVRVGPVYLNHYKVLASLESLRFDPELGSRTPGEILAALEKRWNIDGIDAVTTRDVKITRAAQQLRMQVTYEVTRPVLGNAGVCIRFDDTIEVDLR